MESRAPETLPRRAAPNKNLKKAANAVYLAQVTQSPEAAKDLAPKIAGMMAKSDAQIRPDLFAGQILDEVQRMVEAENGGSDTESESDPGTPEPARRSGGSRPVSSTRVA